MDGYLFFQDVFWRETSKTKKIIMEKT